MGMFGLKLRTNIPCADVIGSNYRCCLLVNANGEVVTEYL